MPKQVGSIKCAKCSLSLFYICKWELWLSYEQIIFKTLRMWFTIVHIIANLTWFSAGNVCLCCILTHQCENMECCCNFFNKKQKRILLKWLLKTCVGVLFNGSFPLDLLFITLRVRYSHCLFPMGSCMCFLLYMKWTCIVCYRGVTVVYVWVISIRAVVEQG